MSISRVILLIRVILEVSLMLLLCPLKNDMTFKITIGLVIDNY
jgi:hypothetical protein